MTTLARITLQVQASIFLDGKEFVFTCFDNADDLKVWFERHCLNLVKIIEEEENEQRTD